MNFSFYILGTPNGYNQFPADNNSTVFQEFAQNNRSESQLTVNRKGQLVYYTYMRQLQEKSGTYLGFCLGFNGVYCTNSKKLFALFDKAFTEVQMKGEILRFGKEKCSYTISKFAEKPIEIERIKTFFKNNLEHDFNRDFVTKPTSFKVGTGKKTISAKEYNRDILIAISEYDTVHIANNEKSLSEPERIHKMLTDLYAENQTLDTKYKKLLGQKKQYKIVISLCLVVIACILGLVIFNKNLQSRDSAIQSLKTDVSEKNRVISRQISNITQLQVVQQRLTKEISNLADTINQNNTVNGEKTVENSNLISENNKLKNNITTLLSDLRAQKNQNQLNQIDLNSLIKENKTMQSELSALRNQAPDLYQVTSKADYYYKNKKNELTKTNASASSGSVKVHKIENGYGLTDNGWVNMSNLSK